MAKPSVARRIVSGVFAVPLGFVFGVVEGGVRTIGYGIDEISRVLQSIFTVIPTKRMFTFSPTLDYETNEVILRSSMGHREFALVVKEYDTRKAAAKDAAIHISGGIVMLLFLPFRLPYNMIKRGLQRTYTAYQLFSGQYNSASNSSMDGSPNTMNLTQTRECNNPAPIIDRSRLPRVQHLIFNDKDEVRCVNGRVL